MVSVCLVSSNIRHFTMPEAGPGIALGPPVFWANPLIAHKGDTMKAFTPVLMMTLALASTAQAADFQLVGSSDYGRRVRVSTDATITLEKGDVLYLRGQELDQFGASGRIVPIRGFLIAGRKEVDVVSSGRGRDRDSELEIHALETTRDFRPAVVQIETRFSSIPIELRVHVVRKQLRFDHRSAADAVERAYQAILFRATDPGADGYIRSILKEGEKGWESALRNIARSAEFFSNVRPNKSDEEILENLYRHLLDRGVDPVGRRAYLPMIARGQVGEAAASIGTSEEFAERIHR